jgi:uncharacterized protein YdaU (DUF1376 family)
VNFYKRYPADYGKKTARLTLMQHGAYTLLLDELYSTEAPLPAALDELYRVCRAMKSAEQEAVKVVAERFFPIAEDGLRHNKRATEELIEAAPALEAARLNGKKGGRPKGITHKKPTGFPKHNPEGTHGEPSTKPPHSSESSSLRSEDMATVFEVAWKAYPRRPGASRADSLKAWTARVREGVDPAVILAGVQRYAAYCAACETEPNFIKQPATFFGPGEHYLSDWTAPAPRHSPAVNTETPYQRSQRELVEQATGGLVSRKNPGNGAIDEHATPLALGR